MSWPLRQLVRLGLLRPRRVISLTEMSRGPAAVEGRLCCERPLGSPIHGTSCAGYSYTASHLGWRTVGPSTRKLLRRAQVFADSLSLQLDGDELIDVHPKRSDDFDADSHRRLVEQDLPGFLARELLLLPDKRVLALGLAHEHEGKWTLALDSLSILKLDSKTRVVDNR